MRLVRWLIGLAVFLGALLFALQNTELVTLRFYYLFSWQAPLIVALLIAFALGAAAGVLASFVRVARLRRQLARMRRLQRARPGAGSVAPTQGA